MKKWNRRKYLTYTFGFAISIVSLLAYAYTKTRDGLFRRSESTLVTETVPKSRIPLGQRETNQLQVLHVGAIPSFDPSKWNFEVLGLVRNPVLLSWTEFRSLAEVESLSDFHCVTGWSKLDNRWGGVQFKKISEMVQPEAKAHYATIICDGGYSTSLPLDELIDDEVLFAYKLDGKDLESRFGGPLRLVVPKKYAYKSAKWVRKVKFTEEQELGYWELRGYSNTADPWTEDRYSS